MDWFFDTAEAVSAELEIWFGSVLSTATDWQMLGKIATVGGVVAFIVLIATAIYTVFFKWPHQKRAFVAERERDAANQARIDRLSAQVEKLTDALLAGQLAAAEGPVSPEATAAARRDIAAVVERAEAAAETSQDPTAEAIAAALERQDPAEATRLYARRADDRASDAAAARQRAAQDYRDAAALNRLSNVRLAADYLMRAAELDPSDLAAVHDAGRAAVEAGRLDHARSLVELGARESALRQDDWWRMCFANDHGDIEVAAGNLDAALQQYRDAGDIAQRLAQNDPGNDASYTRNVQRDLSVSHNKVGDVLVAQGNLTQALDAFNASLEIRQRLAQNDPGNAGWQRDLSVSHNKVGDVLVAQGNLTQALDAFNASLAIAQRLAQNDPGNAGWQADLAASYGKLGQLHVALGEKEAARELFAKGRAIVAPLAERSGHQRWLGYLRSFDGALANLTD